MLSFQRPDVFVRSYTSDVEILYKALEFTFSMIYKTTVKYQPVVFSENVYIVSEIRSLNAKDSAIGLTEFCIRISRFTVIRPF